MCLITLPQFLPDKAATLPVMSNIVSFVYKSTLMTPLRIVSDTLAPEIHFTHFKQYTYIPAK